jgi:hypothetical protein
MKKHLIVIIICLVVAAATFATYYVFISNRGTPYYVSRDGDDSWNGLYPTYQGGNDGPWATVSRVNSFNFQPGDDIYFRRGDSFRDDYLRIRFGGALADDMIIGAYGSGDKPNLERISCTTNNLEKVVIENLDLGPTTARNMLFIEGNNLRDFIIRNVDGHDCDVGIQIRAVDGYQILNCHIWDGADNAFVIYGSSEGDATNGVIQDCTATNVGEGFTLHKSDNGLYGLGPNHKLENCVVNRANGEDSFDIVSGSYIEVINCEGHNTAYGLGIGHGVSHVIIDGYIGTDSGRTGIVIIDCHDVTIKNSVITGSTWDTIRIYGSVTDLEMHNNYFEHPADAERSLIRIGESGSTQNGIYIHDNILISNDIGHCINYAAGTTPQNTNSDYQNNKWWQYNGVTDPFGYISGIGQISFNDWQNIFPTDSFEEPPPDPKPPTPPATPGLEFFLFIFAILFMMLWGKIYGNKRKT